MEHSDWLAFGLDFTLQTITVEMVDFIIFLSPRKFKLSKTQKF